MGVSDREGEKESSSTSKKRLEGRRGRRKVTGGGERVNRGNFPDFRLAPKLFPSLPFFFFRNIGRRDGKYDSRETLFPSLL